jgi:hypothetical protein
MCFFFRLYILFIGSKKEGLDAKVNDVAYTAYSALKSVKGNTVLDMYSYLN